MAISFHCPTLKSIHLLPVHHLPIASFQNYKDSWSPKSQDSSVQNGRKSWVANSSSNKKPGSISFGERLLDYIEGNGLAKSPKQTELNHIEWFSAMDMHSFFGFLSKFCGYLITAISAGNYLPRSAEYLRFLTAISVMLFLISVGKLIAGRCLIPTMLNLVKEKKHEGQKGRSLLWGITLALPSVWRTQMVRDEDIL
eukprot:Gb_11586 [translate_table: standard]